MFGGRRRRREEELARLDRFRVARRFVDEDVTVLAEQVSELHVDTLTDDLDDRARRRGAPRPSGAVLLRPARWVPWHQSGSVSAVVQSHSHAAAAGHGAHFQHSSAEASLGALDGMGGLG